MSKNDHHKNMRLFITLTICLVSALQALATRISEETAFQKAQEFAKGRIIKKLESPEGMKKAKGNTTSNNYYVFNIGEEEGFIIISGDDRTRTVLGYSDTGIFDFDNIPSNMRWLLDSYDSAISSLKDCDGEKAAKALKQNVAGQKEDIAHLISTTWGQGSPYNNSCPKFNGQQCVAGCVATAMAQIINYYRWPQSYTSNIPEYTSEEYKIDMAALPARKFNWDAMDDKEVADLMLYCGQSVNMNYTPEGSGATTARIPHALTDIFHFSKGTLYEEREQYSEQEWLDLIYDQIQRGYPVLYSGRGASSGRHVFILDGYENGMFHVNWGWNGAYDGHYDLDLLNPTSNNSYPLFQYMISYACPPINIDDAGRSKIVVHNIGCNQTVLQRPDINASFPPVEIKGLLASDLTSDCEVQIGFALSDDNGILKVLETDVFEFWTTDNDIQMTQKISITPDIPVGDYKIIAVNRVNDSDDWLPDSKSHARYIDVSITETELHLHNIKKGKDGVETIEFGPLNVDGITYRLVSEYDVLRAYIQSSTSDTQYYGDISIPDFVEYDTFKFKVFGEEGEVFVENNQVTSISSPIALKISNCQNLTDIEYRDGVLNTELISGCPKLNKICLPASCRYVGNIVDCPALKELNFHNLYPITFSQDKDGMLWSNESLPSLSDIYFHGDEPPVMSLKAHSDNANLTIHIPSGLKESYYACGWQEWNIQDDLDKVAEHIKWDYFGYDEDCNDGIAGFSGNNDVEFAMKIPSEESEKYIGNKIVAIEYFSTKSAVKDEVTRNPDYVFLTEKDKDYVVKQSTSAIRGAWTRVTLETPYEINGEDIFVGVGRHRELKMNWANMDTNAGGFWYRAMGTDYSEEEPGIWSHNCDCPEELNHPMPIRAIIQGDDLPTDIAILNAEYKINEVKPLTQVGNMSLKIRNRSPRLIRDLKFDLCYDGKINEPVTATTALPSNHTTTINIISPENIKFNTHFIDLKATIIDGKTDVLTNNSTKTLTLLSTDLDYYPRITVLEESTSRLDGSCANSIAIKEDMKSKFPDNLIAVSLHKDNEMKVIDGSYDELLNGVSDYRPFNLNRTGWQYCFPFNSEIEKLRNKGEVLIKSEAEFSKDGRISIVTNTAFNKNHDDNDAFEIAYVLIENKVGPFEQSNFLSGNSQYNYEYLCQYWWVQQDKNVIYEFADVARTIHTCNESENFFPTEIEKEQVYESMYCMKIPRNIQNCENLKVITLLIDKNTGEILNADRTEITGVIPDLSPELGDSNGNGAINIADAVNIANFVVGKEVEKFHYTASDVNNDGDMSFADASATVSLILNQSTQSTSEYKRICQNGEDTDFDYVKINYDDGKAEEPGTFYLSLNNPAKYVALQADIKLTDNMTVDTINIGKRIEKTHKIAMRRLDEKTIRVTLFDFNNRTFADSDEPILKIKLGNYPKLRHIDVWNIIASDAYAHDYSLICNGQTSGNIEVEGILQDKNIEITLYQNVLEIRNGESKRIAVTAIDGKRVATVESATDLERMRLPSGLYIVKVGNVSEKVMVK